MLFGHDLTFWITIGIAAFVKLFSSPYQGLMKTIFTLATAIFFAWVFTDAVLHILSLNPEVYKYPIAALIALTAEGLAKVVLSILESPSSFIDFIRAWRSGK